MAIAKWPVKNKRIHLGKGYSRLDGPEKVSGAAKYSYDINREGMLYAKICPSRHAHAKINAIDVSAAEKMKGVVVTWVDEDLIGKEAMYAGQILAAVAAETEEIAQDAARRVKISYGPLAPHVIDGDLARATAMEPNTNVRAAKKAMGDVDAAMAKAHVTVEGEYGAEMITHCCLEPHGQVAEMQGDEMHIWASTQGVTQYSKGLDEKIGIPASKIHVDCQHLGGGFGSKFTHYKWGVVCSMLSKKSGKPVKLLLDRDLELMIGGNRPSAFAKIKVGLEKDGTISAFDGKFWGTGSAPKSLAYLFTKVPNQRTEGYRLKNHRGSSVAWRAPGRPQHCLLTLAALDDAAAALKMDALEFFVKNAGQTDRPEVYREELMIAADMIDYKRKAHLRGDAAPGPIKRGLGISMHTWGGLGHDSECDVTIHPDGSVEAKLGTQDLGTGTRTIITMVVAETMGLPLDAVTAKIGKNAYPASKSSGGSTTVGGVSASSRLAATSALNTLLARVAPELGVGAGALEAAGGKIREAKNHSNAIAWKDACGMLGINAITERGTNKRDEYEKIGLTGNGVGGVQIADVSVDIETGIVSINEMVAVQDCGLVVDLKLAESQVYGALIMGVTYALFEECVYDPATGRMLNADMEFYRLAGISDVGRLKVHMMTGEEYDKRGVIGLGEPPVISPGAAISNAVANAIGVRVPRLPLTPDRVIEALQHGGRA